MKTFLRILIPALLLAGAAWPQGGPMRYRSKITVYDLAARSGKVLYQADQVIEAPNWSRDGKFLMVNTGGNLYRLPVAGEAKLEQITLAPGTYRCNNDHDYTRDGKMLAFSATSGTARASQVFVAGADGSGVKLLTPVANASYFHGCPLTASGWPSWGSGTTSSSCSEFR
jgi:TolB protein